MSYPLRICPEGVTHLDKKLLQKPNSDFGYSNLLDKGGYTICPILLPQLRSRSGPSAHRGDSHHSSHPTLYVETVRCVGRAVGSTRNLRHTRPHTLSVVLVLVRPRVVLLLLGPPTAYPVGPARTMARTLHSLSSTSLLLIGYR